MAEARRRARRTAAQWAELVAEFERGDRSRQTFCDAHAIGASSLDYWRRKLEGAPQTATPPFIDLGSIAANASGWNVELDFGHGLVLRLQRA